MTNMTFHRSLLWLAQLFILLALLCLSAIAAEAQTTEPKGAPWWATTLAVAGPIADGLSTHYAIGQSGPNAQIIEGNGFYYKLFGSDVTSNEIMAFKVGQAALTGLVVHGAGLTHRKAAIAGALIMFSVNAIATGYNLRAAGQAKRLNQQGVR